MKKTNATNPKYRAGTPWQLMYLNKTTTNVCTVWMGWMSKHGLAQGNCKNPRHSPAQPYRLFQQNTPVPQQRWFTNKLSISNKRHRRRATHVKSRLILSDIHQKATAKRFWWMSDVKKGEKGKHHWQCKTKSWFSLSTCKCITSDSFPKVSFQWSEMLFTCG